MIVRQCKHPFILLVLTIVRFFLLLTFRLIPFYPKILCLNFRILFIIFLICQFFLITNLLIRLLYSITLTFQYLIRLFIDLNFQLLNLIFLYLVFIKNWITLTFIYQSLISHFHHFYFKIILIIQTTFIYKFRFLVLLIKIYYYFHKLASLISLQFVILLNTSFLSWIFLPFVFIILFLLQKVFYQILFLIINIYFAIHLFFFFLFECHLMIFEAKYEEFNFLFNIYCSNFLKHSMYLTILLLLTLNC